MCEDLDLIAKEYNEEFGFERRLTEYKIWTLRPWCLGPRALDLGCGIGLMSRGLVEAFEEILAVDGSQSKIRRAQELNAHPRIRYVHALFKEFEPPHSVDTIVLTNVLEHVLQPREFLSRSLGWLNPGGRLLVTTPNALALHKRIGFCLGMINDYFELTEADRQKGHYQLFDRARLHTVVRESGYQILHTAGILLKPLSHAQMESWPPELCDALYEVGKEVPDLCSSLFVVAVRPT